MTQTHQPSDLYTAWHFHGLTANGKRDEGEPSRNMLHLDADDERTAIYSTNGAVILGASLPNQGNGALEWSACIPNNSALKDFAAAAKRAKPDLWHDALVHLDPPRTLVDDDDGRSIHAKLTDHTALQVELWLESVDWPSVAIPDELIEDHDPVPVSSVELPSKLKAFTVAEAAADRAGVEPSLHFSNAIAGPIAYWQAEAPTGVKYSCVVLLK